MEVIEILTSETDNPKTASRILKKLQDAGYSVVKVKERRIRPRNIDLNAFEHAIEMDDIFSAAVLGGISLGVNDGE